MEQTQSRDPPRVAVQKVMRLVTYFLFIFIFTVILLKGFIDVLTSSLYYRRYLTMSIYSFNFKKGLLDLEGKIDQALQYIIRKFDIKVKRTHDSKFHVRIH